VLAPHFGVGGFQLAGEPWNVEGTLLLLAAAAQVLPLALSLFGVVREL
jgi:hypothetical protein